MNDQYFGNSINNLTIMLRKIIWKRTARLKIWILIPAKSPRRMMRLLMRRSNIEGTVAGDGPMEEPLAGEVPLGGSVVDNRPLDEETIVAEAPMVENITRQAPVGTALFNPEESEQFRTRWNEIQGKFVDDPRSAVQQADKLVSEVIEQITQMFSSEHRSLEGQWNQGNDVSTEDLRKALQHYRSFFNRLVV